MHILKVQDSYTDREFFKFPLRLYRTNEYWIQPIEHEVKRIFQAEENTFLKHGQICRWILQNYRGATIGRIAAFVDRSAADQQGHPKGCLGFFECIDHQQAAFRLLEEGMLWLQNQQVAMLSAPTNPTSLFLKSGLLTYGFDNPPVYGSNYHPAYYQGFFETFGFQKHFRQQTYRCDIDTLALPDSMQLKAKTVLESKEYKITHFCKEKLGQMASDIASVYNQAWQKHPSYHELSKQQIQSELEDLLPWIDEHIFLLAYHQDQPIGFFFNLPDINQARKQVKGGIFRKMREAYFRNGKHKNLLSVLLGVLPEFQKKGVGSALIQTVLEFLQKNEGVYDVIETSRVRDDNKSMLHLLKKAGGEPHHHYWVYHKHLPVCAVEPSISESQQAVLK
ncbi:MAG: GNAT family N-acetyltransferase [Cyclobacteriaceae bacterium]